MISMIAVVGKNRQIGNKNNLLWKLPKDMARFKALTTDKVVVMGSKTYQSIGRPLPNRHNIVLTKDKSFSASGCEIAYSLSEVLDRYENSKEEAFIIGGGEIYKLALPRVQKLYLTLIDDDPEADTFFPDYSEFKELVKKEEGGDNGFKYQYLELVRN
ncbi:MAG TPA: dihydrofolate reductase [Candidatus Moranbacteria bacterium]|nr:dihydrofolate reductase [Candidatus Moranbacteria bacterium]